MWYADSIPRRKRLTLVPQSLLRVRMPAPTSVPELLDRLRKSKLVPADRLEGFLAALQTAGGVSTPDALLNRLVYAGMITQFHADKLAAGKYKGFQLGDDRYLILDQ